MRYNTQRTERPLISILVVVALIINVYALGRSFGFYRLPGELGALARARSGAELVADHLNRLSASQGLGNNKAVQDALTRLQLDISKARTVDEVSQALQKGLIEAQTVMSREEEGVRRDAILAILGRTPVVQSFRGKASLVLSREEGRELKLQDPEKILDAGIVAELNRHSSLQQAFSTVVELENGQVRVPNQRTLTDRVTALEQELAALRIEHQALRTQSGFLPLTGTGVQIKLFDAFGGYTEDQIVHDSDIRDVVNELVSAGAMGVAVGDQRLIATTSIRCAGPVVLVNHRPIQVNPVIIAAVGDVNVLSSSLQLVKTSLMVTKGVKLEIERVDNMTLPAYTPLR